MSSFTLYLVLMLASDLFLDGFCNGRSFLLLLSLLFGSGGVHLNGFNTLWAA